ncbi:MAG: efflux RND transporter permease subunit [Planctomycetes bacterium]|nr:efflux RND transporter permease subunit [Planctomycetota bacterium]
MLDGLIRWSLRYRTVVLIVCLVVIVYGTFLASQMKIDVFPDLDRPRVVIITEAPGLATEEVETLVTQPLEVALMGASGVQDVRSQTTAGLNVLYVEFDWKTEIRAARQTVGERLATLEGTLPDGIRPQMTPPSSIMGQIVIAGIYRQMGPRGGKLAPIPNTNLIGEVLEAGIEESLKLWEVQDRRRVESWKEVPFELLKWTTTTEFPRSGASEAQIKTEKGTYDLHFRSEGESNAELRTISDWVIRPRILKVNGVAEVFMQGGDRKQYQVLIDPTALQEYHVTLQDVSRALRESNMNASGGFAIEGETERSIRILGRLGQGGRSVVEDLAQVPIASNPQRSVLLSQVAKIVEGAELKRGDGSINAQNGVVFTVVKQPHVDTRRLTNDITRTFVDLEQSLPNDVIVRSDLFQLRNFIDRGIFNVAEALVIGALLVILVLFLFLLDVRTTVITLTAIPLSLVITSLVFRWFSWVSGNDLSINVMTLGGIAVAMGELVDDAIVDVENIFRRLRENQRLPQPSPVLEVIYAASVEIRNAILFGTAVVILVFLPLFALSGVEGRLFAPLGLAYIVSILSSFVVSLSVTPVLSYYLLRNSIRHTDHGDGWVLRALKWLATPLIRFSMNTPLLLLAIAWLGFVIAAWQVTKLGRNFLPAFDEGSVQVNITLPPGASLQANNSVSHDIDTLFLSLRKSAENPMGSILNFVRRSGRAQMDEHASPVNVSEYILSMNPDSHEERDAFIEQLLERLKTEVPGVDVEVEQPLAHLISHMVSGVYAQIAVKIQGEDLDTLLRLAQEAKAELAGIEGITTPLVEPIRMTPELHIKLRGDDLAYYGLTRGDVASVLQTALQGEVVSEVLEGQRRYDLLIRLEETYRSDFANLGRLRLHLPHIEGQAERGQIELREIADVFEGVGPNSINRENARRRIVIRCNTQGRDLAGAVEEIKAKLDAKLNLPTGYFIEYGGQFESQQNATRMILILAGVSVLGMLAVLLILFPSIRIVLQILNALPTAFIGGVVALVLTDQTLTVASLVGFISLGGIAVRNGILLVTHYLHLMNAEGEEFSQQMILRGSLERLAPVLMTALTAGIGLAPLVMGGNEPGREILYPVATVIVGGLCTSTFCEFLIHPGIFWSLTGQDARRLADAAKIRNHKKGK